MKPQHAIRAAQGLFLGAAISMLGYMGITHAAVEAHAKRVQAYVEQHADGWFAAQVHQARLQHLNLTIPHIRYRLSDGLDTTDTGGDYNKETNTIELNARGLRYLQMPRTGFSFTFARKHLIKNPRATVEDTFRHEVGHYFTEVIAARMGYEDWKPKLDAEVEWQLDRQNTAFIFGGDNEPVRQSYLDFLKKHESTLTDVQLYNIVNEGIAEYFESNGTTVDLFTDIDWPSGITDLNKMHRIDLRYGSGNHAGGYHLVRPIIQEYGVKGIEYLIANPPQVLDFRDIPHYQTEALEALCR